MASLFIPLLRLASLEGNQVPDQIFLNILPILVNFPEESFQASSLSPTVSVSYLSARLVGGVLTVAKGSEFSLETESDYERLIPHLVLMNFISRGSPEMKGVISKALLPSDEDRLRPIGEGDTATARLAAVLNATSFSPFKGALCELFYTLCDDDGIIINSLWANRSLSRNNVPDVWVRQRGRLPRE